MELYVLNENIELIHIIDDFTSLMWTRRYYKSGEFELHAPLTSDNIKHLIRDNIIYKKGDDEAGYIETILLKTSADGKEYLEVKGKFLTSYLDRRINWGQLIFNGKAEELMRKLVNDNAVNPTNINRKIPNLILGDFKSFVESIRYQNSYGNVLDCLENISNTNNLGYRNILDIKNKKIRFDVYKGVDRTINNGTIAPCVFSRDFENILEQQYCDSLNNFRNTALVAGIGEGKDRKVTSIEIGQGLDRYELYVDARDLQDKQTIDNVEVPIPDGDYIQLMKQRGNEKLAEYKEIKTFDSIINTKGNNIYKVDYNLGDVVTVVDKKWNLRLDTRITEIQEIYEGGKVDINLTFGNNIPTIMDAFKRMVR